jgi:hypothetical protein
MQRMWKDAIPLLLQVIYSSPSAREICSICQPSSLPFQWWRICLTNATDFSKLATLLKMLINWILTLRKLVRGNVSGKILPVSSGPKVKTARSSVTLVSIYESTRRRKQPATSLSLSPLQEPQIPKAMQLLVLGEGYKTFPLRSNVQKVSTLFWEQNTTCCNSREQPNYWKESVFKFRSVNNSSCCR